VSETQQGDEADEIRASKIAATLAAHPRCSADVEVRGMTYVGGPPLRQEALGSPRYSILAIVLALAFLLFASGVQQWLRGRKNGEHPPSARWFWYASLVVAGPLIARSSFPVLDAFQGSE
jgi:hypothetical protein